jgi:pimeloyl-ACP methyl ester carboxylesterase
VVATPPSLPDPVKQALANPPPGRRWWAEAAGYRWHGVEWGDPADPPILLVHGVTSDGGTFWRLGPALAAAGRHAVAVDLPGHGRTGGWRGRHRFEETADDVRALLETLGLVREDLAVLGHSWGARTVTSLPAVGLTPRRLILLDPPVLTLEQLQFMTLDPEEQPISEPDQAVAILAAAHPDWSPGDVLAKAEGLTRFDREAVRAVLLDNGHWDAGLDQLAHPAAQDVDIWLIRGEPAHGGLTADHVMPAFEQRLGADRVVTIPGGPHSPQRTHIDELTAALLDILG